MFTDIPNHVELALERLPECMRRPRIQALLTTLVEPCQEVETALAQLRDGMHPGGAIGEQLNMLGRVLKWPRREMNDATYRPMLQVANRVNKSSSWADDLIQIIGIIEPDLGVSYQDSPPAEYILRLDDVTETPLEVIETIVRRTRPAGTRVHFEWLDVDPDDTWTLKNFDDDDEDVTETPLRSWFDEDPEAGANGRRAWSDSPT